MQCCIRIRHTRWHYQHMPDQKLAKFGDEHSYGDATMPCVWCSGMYGAVSSKVWCVAMSASLTTACISTPGSSRPWSGVTASLCLPMMVSRSHPKPMQLKPGPGIMGVATLCAIVTDCWLMASHCCGIVALPALTTSVICSPHTSCCF